MHMHVLAYNLLNYASQFIRSLLDLCLYTHKNMHHASLEIAIAIAKYI